MPAFTAGGTEYEIATWRERHVSNVAVARAWDDTLVTSRPSANATIKEWDAETGILTESAADTLIGVLKAAGTVTVAGDLPGASVTVHCSNIGWVPVQDQDRRRVTFTARTVTP